MAVPNIFGTATAAIPLSQLDTNFATAITLGNTAVYLGNTTTSLGNVTLTNVTISSGNVTLTGANVSGTANISTLIVTGNQTSLGNVAITGNISANIVTVAAGAVGTPSITTTGDTNTGIFFPAADTIAFSEGGVESVRIDSDGDVGIGTASPTNKLHVSSSSFETIKLQGTSTVSGINFVNSASSNGYIYYDNGPSMLFYTNGSERMRIDSSGNVIVGGTSTSSDESTYQGGGVFTSRRASSAGTTHANFLNGGSTVGSITSNTTTTFYNITSDYRLKENATPVTTGLQTIAALNPVNFNWVSNRIADTGFLAHEFQSVIPNCVIGTKDAIDASGNPVYQQIDRSGAIPFLVAAIKEQQALITALTARITALEQA